MALNCGNRGNITLRWCGRYEGVIDQRSTLSAAAQLHRYLAPFAGRGSLRSSLVGGPVEACPGNSESINAYASSLPLFLPN